MRNTLVDSELGDVESINMPIGQSTPFPGSFTAVTVGAVGGVAESWAPSIGIPATTNSFAAAVALTAANNVVTSVTFTSGSPVALPSVATWQGGAINVFNQTTMTVGVWPQPADHIDALPASSGVLLDAGKRCTFYAPTATQIISAQLGVTSV